MLVITGLIAGVIGYCIYVIGFCVAVLFQYVDVDLAWLVTCVSATIGGIAGGLLWTAQGRYFSTHSNFYAESSGIPIEKINATFAGVFATTFLGRRATNELLNDFKCDKSNRIPFITDEILSMVMII
jgi:hypothetical protein